MIVDGNLAFEQAHSVRAARFAKVVQTQSRPLPWVHRSTSLQVGQGEVALAIPAIGGAEQREERGVLPEWQELAIAPGPALGREVEGEDANFSDKRVGHQDLLLCRRGADAKQRDDEVDAEIRLQIGMWLATACRGDDLLVQLHRRTASAVKLRRRLSR